MESTKTSSDEINLEELTIGIILTLKKNIRLIVLLFIVGTALGIARGTLSTKVYESKMMLSSDLLTESYVDKLGKNLNDIIKEGNLELLASKINVTPEEAKIVRSIEIEGVQKEKQQIENEKVPFFMLITVEVTDQEFLAKLQQGIVGYLENNDFVKSRVEQRKESNRQLISQIENEIKSLEELKKRFFEGDFAGGGGKGNVSVDITEVNSKIIELTEQKLECQTSLQFGNSVQVVEDFTIFRHPKRPNLAANVIAGAFLGFLMGGFVLLFRVVSKKVKLAEAQQNQ